MKKASKISSPGTETYRSILSQELNRRQQINPRYSLRSFARDLDMTSGRLSEILNWKQGLSPARAQKIALQLKLPVDQQLRFVDLVRVEHSRSQRERSEARSRLDMCDGSELYRTLELAELRCLSDWLPFALLEWLKMRGEKFSLSSLAQLFSVSVDHIRTAIQSLEKVGLLERKEDGWQAHSESTFSGKPVPSLVVKKYHLELMKRATKALYNQPMHEREFQSLVLKVNRQSMPELKHRIRKFVREMDQEFSGDEHTTDVVALSMQMFLLSEDRS